MTAWVPWRRRKSVGSGAARPGPVPAPAPAPAPERGMADRTVLYAVHGKDLYFHEATCSARSVRAHDRQARIVAYVRPEDAGRLDATVFDDVRPRAFALRADLRIDFQLKLIALSDGLVGPVLFLDTDTRVCAPLDAAWELLGRFDVLACHAPFRRRLRFENYATPDFVSDVPDAFCELNTGALFLADTPGVRTVLDSWQRLYAAAPGSGDQYLFMHALYNSDCRLYVLPPEYNFRYRVPQFAGDRVRIVHGHGGEIEQALEVVNQSVQPRVSHFETGALTVTAGRFRPPEPKSPGTGTDHVR